MPYVMHMSCMTVISDCQTKGTRPCLLDMTVLHGVLSNRSLVRPTKCRGEPSSTPPA